MVARAVSGCGRSNGHQLVAVDADHDIGDRPGRNEAPCAVRPGRPQGDSGDTGAFHHVVDRVDARGDHVLNERNRGNGTSHRLGHDHQVRQRGPPTAGRVGHAHAGRAHVDQPVPKAAIEPERFGGARHRGRALLDEEPGERLLYRQLVLG
jgi:hypothetical protein